MKEFKEMMEVLDDSSLFQDLSPEQLKEVGQFCEGLSLADGDFLMRESEQDEDLYLICSGQVEIVSNDSLVTSHEVVISKEDKDVFGEIAWLTGRERTASVRCHGDVQAIRVDGKVLKAYLDAQPEVGYLVMRRIAIIQSQRMDSTDSLLKQILWNTAF